MTTFKDFSEGRCSNLKFSPGLVLGWLVTCNNMEIRYALFNNGNVLKSSPVSVFGRDADEFAPKGRKWIKVNEVPGHAEFIGNYKAPS